MQGSSRLSPLQQDLLAAFFAREQRFFLTGGAALAGYYLHHRRTSDLDLFATGDTSINQGVRARRRLSERRSIPCRRVRIFAASPLVAAMS
jgi:hypothetical protein